jgi:YbbR domain-containing protein
MKLNPLIEKIIHDWKPKVFCLAIALLLSLFYQFISLDHKNFSVHLEVKNNGIMMPASPYAGFVRVTFRGQRDDVAAVLENEFQAFLDLSYYTEEGTYDVPVKVELSSELMKLDPLEIRLSPETIPLKIERRIFAEIPLAPMLQGEAAEGFEIASVKPTPSTVRVSGPRSLVENLQSLPLEEIAINGSSRSFITNAKITRVSSFIRVERDEPVDVEVTITEKTGSRLFSIPIIALNMPAEFSITAMSIETVEIEVSASELAFERLQPSSLSALIDFSTADSEGTYELPVNVALPAGFTLISQTPATLTVRVTEADVD